MSAPVQLPVLARIDRIWELNATPTVPKPLEREAMIPATKVACWSKPTGWLRLETMSVESEETAPTRSRWVGSTPESITATVIPLPLAPAAKAASVCISANP